MEERRSFVLTPTLHSIRETQLYRTLPHEIGHAVDYEVKVRRGDDDDYVGRVEAYWSCPQREREAFAHRYADELRARLRAEMAIPFPRILDEESLRRDGLDLGWFEI